MAEDSVGATVALLEGVLVVESAAVITGPLAGMMLADLGARVVKVEPLGGDQFRQWVGAEESVQPSFAAFNRGKQSMAVDLKTAGGQDVLRRLAGQADIFIENFRPGAMERLGIGSQSLMSINPRLIYCHITGMGSTGPDRDLPTYDAVAQALSGLWSQFTDLQQPEPVGPPTSDQLTALYAVIGVLAALRHKMETGAGKFIEVNMLASSLAFQSQSVSALQHGAETPTKSSRARRSQTYAFVTLDDLPVAVHLSTPSKFWEGLCRATKRPDLINDPRFNTKAKRISHYDDLHGIFRDIFSTRNRGEWLTRLRTEDVPCAPILDVREALLSPQVVESELIEGPPSETEYGGLVRSPIRMGGRYLSSGLKAPHLGHDTRIVLRELGYEEAEVEQLYSRDAVFG